MERAISLIEGVLWDEEGFSTVGVALSLLLTLSLIFTAAQVYELDSASADVQEVADAAALASQNVVGEFYLLASVCDAVILSLSLGSVACLGIGVAASCVPPAAPISRTLIKASSDMAQARDRFGSLASEGLSRIQGLLPFLAMAKAAQVSRANGGGDHAQYASVAVLSPFDADLLETPDFSKSDAAQDAAEEGQDKLESEAAKAEEAAKEANEWKQKAYEADSGSRTKYCMYQRALTLADMKGSSNPYFSSVETWSFSAALKRSRAYYAKRLRTESPDGSSVLEKARSSLRKRVFSYAVKEMKKGYVRESEASFSAYFPLLPKNTSEMRKTELYTQAVYPIALDKEGMRCMHAWSGCPGMDGCQRIGVGSISQMESSTYVTCARCEFKAASMGKVLSASTNVDNGFEHYYRIVAEAAKEYQDARERLAPAKDAVEELAGNLFDMVEDALGQAAESRIRVSPPGRMGVVVITVDLSRHSASSVFPSTFVSTSGSLGPRVALSSACLLREESDEGETVISSFLDGVASKGDEGAVLGGARLALSLWSNLLRGYAQGQQAVVAGIKDSLDSIPFASESGLGDWASGRLLDVIERFGLEPPELRAAKAVLVNSGDVLSHMDGVFSARLMSLKSLAGSSSDGSLFSGALNQAEQAALGSLSFFDEEIELGSIRIIEGAVEIPLVISLPGFAKEYAGGIVGSFFDSVESLVSSLSANRRWE